jgi:hypothetical protein
LREMLTAARDRLSAAGQRTLLFVDEIHRFNKAQQDVLLPEFKGISNAQFLPMALEQSAPPSTWGSALLGFKTVLAHAPSLLLARVVCSRCWIRPTASALWNGVG